VIAAPPTGTAVSVKCLGNSGIATASGVTLADGRHSVALRFEP
jgi:hypothetical protein